MTEEELRFKELALQLSCPEGEKGKEISAKQSIGNSLMIRNTIEVLNLAENDEVLELGGGNSKHLEFLLSQSTNLTYKGLEISESALEQAKKINHQLLKSDKVTLSLYDGEIIPFPSLSFKKIVTINTIFFWKEPVFFIREINRVLELKGILCITFRTEEYMKTLPFAKYGFKLYNKEKIEQLLEGTDLQIKNIYKREEEADKWSSNKAYYIFEIQKMA